MVFEIADSSEVADEDAIGLSFIDEFKVACFLRLLNPRCGEVDRGVTTSAADDFDSFFVAADVFKVSVDSLDSSL